MAVAHGTFGASGHVTIAGGTGVIVVGPVPPHQIWEVARYSVSGNASRGEVRMYLNHVSDTTLIDSSYDGVSNRGDINITLSPGDSIIFEWRAIEPADGPSMYGNVTYRLVTL